MSSHASMNRIFRLVWNDASGTWIAVAEVARGRIKRSGRAARRMAEVLAASALTATAFAAPPAAPPAPTQLPTGGSVAAGTATLRAPAGGAVLNIEQVTQRAVINWSTFDIGSAAQVNFNQPGATSVTLNRVLGSDASQIAGRITAPGQVFLTNPNGILFGKTATVDVGGLTATTLGIADADFMAGKTSFTRDGAAGSVVNEGLLRASLGGYIALLAPEVRNQGVVIARMGTVALAAGDTVSLDFDANSKLAGITVQASALQALVRNQGAVLAPGGLVVLSAQALDRLQGGVVNNSGQIEATGLSSKAGRIVLDASDRVEAGGSIAVDGKTTGGPAGRIAIDARDIAVDGVVTATGVNAQGGRIDLVASRNVDLSNAVLDVSGGAAGGSIHIQGGATPVDLALGVDGPATIVSTGSTRLVADSRLGLAGGIALTADTVRLLDRTGIDARGATGGGTVQVGGGYQGSGDLPQARRVEFAPGASIDASATGQGSGGTVSLWSDIHRDDSATIAHGTLSATGGSQGGDGGRIETSGHWIDTSGARVSAAAVHGAAGSWLLDPYNVTISTSAAVNNSGWAPTGTGSNLYVGDLNTALNGGTSIVVTTGSSGSELGDLNVNAAISKTAGADVSLTLRAANSIVVNNPITSTVGKLNLVLDADNNNGSRDGAGVVILNSNIATNGGSLAFGTGATLAINGVTTKVGGDVYVGGSSAQTLTTAGGSVTVNGEMILANTSGLTINSGNGNVNFTGLLNSGDTYTGVAGTVNTGSWDQAYTAAKGSTGGGTSVGDTYLATITSRLENAVASRAANYTGAWFGAHRDVNNGNGYIWRWVAGPEGQEAGGGRAFFQQTVGSNGGTAINGQYNNFAPGEPNGSGTTGESVSQFFGTLAQWNDLVSATNYSASSSSQYAVTQYLRETNLAASPLTVNAGTGTVTFAGMVGGAKALASLNVTAASIGINGGGVTTEGLQTYNAPVTLGSAATVLTQTNANADFTLSANRSITNAFGANASLTIATPGGIVLAKGSSIASTTGALTTVLNADSDASGAGYIWLQGDGTTGATISSNGGAITLSGGATPASGYAAGGSTGNSNGVTLDTATLNSAGGAIVVRGKGSATLASYTVSEGAGPNSDGIRLFGSNTLNAGTGTISLTGVGRATDGSASNGIETSGQGYTRISSSAANTTAITLSGDASAGTSSSGGWGTFLWGNANAGIVLAATGSNGGISIDGIGRGGVANGGGTHFEPNSYVLASSGPISISGTKGSSSTYAGIVLNGSIGAAPTLPTGFGSSPVMASSSNITLTTDTLGANHVFGSGSFAGSAVRSSGVLTIVPRTVGKALTVQSSNPGGTAAWVDTNSMFGANGLVKPGFSNVVFGSATTGTVTLDNYAFENDTLVASSGNAVLGAISDLEHTLAVNMTGSGSITDTGNVAVWKLALNGSTSAATLDSSGNAIGTVAASVASLALTNASALTVGTVGSLNGITASGTVAVNTLVGDLTVAQNIASANTGTAAVVLNAGKTAAAGTASGGNIVRSGTPTITTGSGGRVTLMTGSISGSTTAAALAGPGSGHLRYGSDETTTAYTTALGSGTNVVYREQPVLTVVAATASKVYDGVAYSGGNGNTVTGYVNGDTASILTGSVSYGGSAQGATAASAYTITPSGLGNGLGYGFAYVGGTLTISPRPVTLTGSRSYDGTAAIAGGVLGVSNTVGSDSLSLTGSGTLASKNVGSRSITSFGTLALSGASAGNYTLAGASGSATLTQASLTVSAPAGATKTYDGTTNVQGSATVGALAGAAAGEIVGTAPLVTYADANAGSGKTVQSAGLRIRDANGADVTSNYAVTYTASSSGVINRAPLTVTANDDARFVSQLDDPSFNGVSYAGLVGSESASVLGGTLAVTRPNAGTDVGAGTYAGALVPSGLTSSNYAVTFANGSYTIVPANQLLIKVTNASAAYGSAPAFSIASAAYLDANGTTIVPLTGSATGNTFSYNDGAGGSVTFTLSPQGAVTSSAGKAVVGNYAVADTSPTIGGSNFTNYTFVGNLAVTRAAVSATASNVSKVYDGTTDMSGVSVDLSGKQVGDLVTVSGTGAFSQKNAGTGLAYAVNGLALGGADSGNYYLSGGSSLSGSNGVITPASLSVTGVGATAKIYDATTTATLTGAPTVTAIGADAVSVVGTGAGSFADKNVGATKAVTVTGYALTGADAGNYALVLPAGVTAAITPAGLSVTGVGAVGKTYDGTTASALTGAPTVSALGGDVVSLGGTGVGSFADKNAGVGKAVTVSGYTLGGADAGNYTLVLPAGLTATIAPKSLTLGGNLAALDRAYNATTAATLTGAPTLSVLGGDVVSLGGTGVGTFVDKNAGANKSVTVAGYTLGGADAGNYALVQPSGLTATITPASLVVGGNLAALDRAYNATTAATLTGAATVAALGSDVLSLGGTGVASFVDKNAGANKSVTVAGYTLGGADAGNYALVQPNGLTATITPASLTVGGNLAALDRTYNATVSATLTGTPTVTGLGGDVVSLGGTGVGTFADKNAGAHKSVTVAGYTLAGADAGNYALVQPTGLTATIAPASLSLGGNLAAVSRTYDTTSVAGLSGVPTVTPIAGDFVGIGGTGVGSFADKNVGANKAVSVSGYTLAGADAGNYTLVLPTGLTATITPANLTVGGNLVALGKTYDATTAATLTGAPTVTGLGSDAVSIGGTGVGTFVDKNAGASKSVTVAGYTLTGADAGNYALVQPSGLNATITPASLTVGGNLGALGKTYDATTAATLSGAPTVTGIGSDVVAVGGTGVGTFVDKNAGANKSVTVAGYTLTGADAGNYALVQPSGLTATITPASLTVGGNLVALGKTYDATTAATLSGAPTVTGIGSDVVAVGGTGTGTFVDKTAGANKSVMVAGYTLTGADAGNYALVQPTGLTATITPASLAVGGNLVALGKTYDATTAATLSGAPTVTGLGSDAVSIGGTGVGTFVDKTAGANKSVMVAGYTLTGADAGNYSLVQPSGLTATITPASLTVGGNLGALGKTYDATTAATLSGAPTVTGIGSDVVAVGGTGVGTFVDKNAGANKSVTVAGYTLTGADAGNYALVQPSGLTATITPASLTVGGNLVALGKTYDATTAATLTGAPTVTGIGSDAVSIGGTGVGTFVDKNAGASKSVMVAGYTLTGADAGNYSLVQPSGLNATITPASLTVGGNLVALGKTYDATTAATLTGAPTVTGIGSDAVSIGGTGVGTFVDKNAGASKSVTVAGYTLTGADSGNYALVQPSGLTATITPASLTVGGNLVALGKTYDATTAATLTGAPIVTGLGSDAVSIGGTGVGTFVDKNAGANKSVTVAGYTLTGADAGNYALVQPSGLIATITPASLAVGGNLVALGKTYDATTAATLSGAPTVTGIGSDVVAVGGAGIGFFADKNAGANKAVTISGFALTGADAGNYALVQPTGLTATITPANLTVGGTLTALGKVYDGSPIATLTGTPTVAAVGNDIVNLGGTGIASFADRNVGAGKTVTVSGYALGGADAGNYRLVEPTGLQADITPRALGVTASVSGKVYDGGTAASVTLADNRVAGDALSLGYAVAAFADKNAGSGKTVNVSGIAATGADAGNYRVATSATATGDIARASLQITATGVAKTYDATTGAAVTLSDNRLTGDVLFLNYGSATLADKAAGLGKAVDVEGISVTGADAGNYRFSTGTTTTVDVAKAILTVGVVARPRPFDGTNAVGVTLTDNRLAGDQLVLSYAGAGFADASIGTARPVAVTGIKIAGGADQANYVLGNASASTTADIGLPVSDPQTVAGSGAVAPVLAPVAPVPVPTAPRGGVDLTLPGAIAAAGVPTAVLAPQSTAAVTPGAGGGDVATGVWVALARAPATGQSGVVTVSVPKTMTSSGAGFSFPLPAEVAQVTGSENARVTLLDGAPLPSWLSFSGASHAFTSSSAPAGALPIELIVSIGSQQWTVTVTERAAK